MGIVNSDKGLSKTEIKCGESFFITLSLAAAPDIKSTPKEICLILDRSGSMGAAGISALKTGVNKFIDIIDKESDGTENGVIGGGSKISIVSFSQDAVIDVPLTTSVADLKKAVEALKHGGITNHNNAFIKADEALSAPSAYEKIIIMFTDGESNPGSEGFAEAEALKAKGVTIYSIGYGDANKISPETLNKWASSPSAAYTLITPELSGIEAAFTGLLRNIQLSGASDIEITDTLDGCFEIMSAAMPSKGNADIVDRQTIKWTIPELGKTGSEGAELTFTVKHTGSCTGKISPNKTIEYKDREANTVLFSNPQLDVLCDNPVVSEGCPVGTDFTAPSCADAVQVNAQDTVLSDLGRIIEVNTVIKNVCPNKKVALAAVLYEKDLSGAELMRGMKTYLIPETGEATCTDIQVKCIKFAVPEALDPSGNVNSICNERKFNIKFIAHYIDSDFTCCK